MSTFDKILIRTSLTDEGGTLPRTGTLSNSPDVIPYGTTAVEDPISFFIDNFDKNVNAELKGTLQNYIYMRGKQLATGVQKGDMYMFYALDADLNTPSKWATNILKTPTSKTFQSVVGQSKDSVLVAAEPFLWTPPAPPDGVSYSLIGIVVAPGTTPDFSGVTNFEEFVANNLNVGWTKVTIKKPLPPPIPGQRWQTTFAYNNGSDERDMYFDLVCHNIPVGSYVSFKADTATGPNPPIVLDKTKISDPNQKVGIESIVPADYKSNINFSLYINDTPPPGSSVTFKAYYYDTSKPGPAKPVVVASVTTTN